MGDDNGNGKKVLTRSDKFKNYALGLGACTALILGVINMFWDRVAPVEKKADDGYATLAQQVNKLAAFSRRVRLKLAVLQGKEEQRTSMKLFQELESVKRANQRLQERLDTLLAGKKGRAARPRAVGGAGAAKMAGTAGAAVQIAQKALEVERARRKKAEARKRALLRKIHATKKGDIRPVPTKLRDVGQKPAPPAMPAWGD